MHKSPEVGLRVWAVCVPCRSDATPVLRLPALAGNSAPPAPLAPADARPLRPVGSGKQCRQRIERSGNVWSGQPHGAGGTAEPGTHQQPCQVVAALCAAAVSGDCAARVAAKAGLLLQPWRAPMQMHGAGGRNRADNWHGFLGHIAAPTWRVQHLSDAAARCAAASGGCAASTAVQALKLRPGRASVQGRGAHSGRLPARVGSGSRLPSRQPSSQRA